MSLLFSDICTFLSRCEAIETRQPPILSSSEKSQQLQAITESWFKSHRRVINDASARSSAALLSVLFPERRRDRVYGLQAPRLCKLLSRCLGLGVSHTRLLFAYTRPGHADLAACLEMVLDAGGPPAIPPVTLDEVDDMLQVLASSTRFSGPAVRALGGTSPRAREKLLGNIFKRLRPSEAKWLVRVLLKDLSPVVVDEYNAMRSFHFLLPDLLRFQDDFDAVMTLLKGPLRQYPDHPDPRSERLHQQNVALSLEPTVGIKVGHPTFAKARSIDHCMDMLGGRRWVLERKYDGEYCEIHVDLNRSSRPSECLRIFSKSGRDSTSDRAGLHQTLVEALRLGKGNCRIKRRAIILGELVVYSDQKTDIMAFDEIRRHVSRSGVFLGTAVDSPPRDALEHLAIVFFDLLLLDEEAILKLSVEKRRVRLREVYDKIPGRAIGAGWKLLDFCNAIRGREILVKQFAASIAQRHEGLVFKPCDVPYVFIGDETGNYHPRYIKLKKDYIDGLGDEADFAVVGARYDAQRALKIGQGGLKWTHFYLGCMSNKNEVIRFGVRPRFRIVACVGDESCIPNSVLHTANVLGSFCASDFDPSQQPKSFDIAINDKLKMTTCFEVPLVFEILGSGFVKPPNSGFFMLRHPRVKKLHEDRSWKDCISFQNLQRQAVAAGAVPVEQDSQETRFWIEKLGRKCSRKWEREHMVTPSRTDSTTCGSEGRTSGARPKRPRDRMDQSSRLNGKKRRANRDGRIVQCVDGSREYAAPSEGNALADITKQITNLSPSRTAAHARRKAASQTSPLSRPPALGEEVRKAMHRSQGHRPSSRDASHRPLPGSPSCKEATCLFANTSVYLSPCIANTPYISIDLLSIHNTHVVTHLASWDRDCGAHPRLCEVVSESQAYAGLRKVALLEQRRRVAVRGQLGEILALNEGRLRDRIEVWDWRVLERCTQHCDVERGEETAGFSEHYIGAVEFDLESERTFWVGTKEWL